MNTTSITSYRNPTLCSTATSADCSDLVCRYESGHASVAERAARTEKARRKKGERKYISKLNVPGVPECYAVNISGEADNRIIVFKYGRRYCYAVDHYDGRGFECCSLTVLTEHFVERYRVRNNMYASSNKDVLYDIIDNLGGCYTNSTDRFERAAVLNNGNVAPLDEKYVKYHGHCILVSTVLTCLNKQDVKVNKLKQAIEAGKRKMPSNYIII